MLIPGISTFLLIAIFAPFGFRELAPGNRLLFALALGLLSSLSVVMVVEVCCMEKYGLLQALLLMSCG